MPKLEINIKKTYNVPQDVVVRKIEDKILVISPNTANWLLFHSESQLMIYNMLSQKKSILFVLQKYPKLKKDVISVVRELEAKNFENKKINFLDFKSAYIYLTNKCNSYCKHCYMSSGEAYNDELTTIEVLRMIDFFSEHGINSVNFTGGEASLRDDFVSLLRYAKNNGMRVYVFTNGVNWNKKFIERIKNYINTVQISLDGYDRQTYSLVRGIDAFDVVMNTISLLSDANIQTNVTITPLPNTLFEHTQEYMNFSNAMRERYKRKKVNIQFNNELLSGRHLIVTDDLNQIYKNEISKLQVNSLEENFVNQHINNIGYNNCGYGTIAVESNGNVYACNIIKKCACIGNIRTETLEDIFIRIKKIRTLSTVDNLVPCKNCDLRFLCGGGCRIKHFSKLTSQNFKSNNLFAQFVRDDECSKEYREKLYSLMIKTNEYFYIS